MSNKTEYGADMHVAGERVPPGVYKHVDSTYIVEFDHEDTLPGLMDGRVTIYVQVIRQGSDGLR